MRIILINTQIVLLLLLAFAVIAAAGGLAGMFTATSGGGPAALGAIVYVVMITAAAVAGLVGYVIPLAVFASLTLVFAVLAGWRRLHWCRFLGIFANFAGVAYFWCLHFFVDFLPYSFVFLFAAYHIFNCLLFLFMPRRPSLRLTRLAALWAQPVLYLLPAGLIVLVIASPRESTTHLWIGAAVFLALFALPFLLNIRTVPLASRPAGKKLAWRLALSSLLTVLALAAIFPFGLPMVVGTLLLLELTEATNLYPEAPPPAGGAREWLARILGALPATSSAETIRQPENNGDDHHGKEAPETPNQTGPEAG